MEIWGPRLAPELTLRREGAGFLGRRSPKEIEVGDDGFDEVVSVQGPLDAGARASSIPTCAMPSRPGARPAGPAGPPAALGLRPARRRRAARSTFRSTCRSCGGASEDQELTWPARSTWTAEYKLPEVLRAALDLAGRLEVPEHLADRLADNLKSEPEAGVRRKTLARLLSEFPEAAESAAALRTAARGDPDADVRFGPRSRSARKGRDVLLGVAAGEGAEDATTARAVAALDRLADGRGGPRAAARARCARDGF